MLNRLASETNSVHAPKQAVPRAPAKEVAQEDEVPDVDAGEPPLATSMSLIRGWMDCFTREEHSFDSISVLFETRLREAVVQTSAVGMAVPNRAHAATCCDLLLKLPHIFGRYAPLVTKLVTEVMRCVYKNYDSYLEQFAAKHPAILDGAAPSDALLSPSKLALPNASDLFQLTAWFDLARSIQKRARLLQDEVKERSAGAGLAQLFRERFLLWDDRNLLLRCILFRGWRKYVRTMVAGRARLALMRLQYWFDRCWEGIELGREECEIADNLTVSTVAADNGTQFTTSRSKDLHNSVIRRSVRASRRGSKLFSAEAIEASAGIMDVKRATELSLAFLGTASNRTATLVALDQMASEQLVDDRTLTAKEILVTLISIMQTKASVKLGPSLALNADFARALSLWGEPPPVLDPVTFGQLGLTSPAESCNSNTADEPVDYGRWLGCFCESAKADEGSKHQVNPLEATIRAVRGLGPPFPKEFLKFLVDTVGVSVPASTEVQGFGTFDGTSSSDCAIQTDEPSFGDDSHACAGENKSNKRSGKVGSSCKANSLPTHADKVATSSVAIASVCHLIPLVYDSLLEMCSGGDVNEAAKVKLAEVGKRALMRRFGIKTIAANYYSGMIRTAKLCADRDSRIALFSLVFSIESSDNDVTARNCKKKSASSREAAIIATFCELWHSYLSALQVYESAKMKVPATRKKTREVFRQRRLSVKRPKHVSGPAVENFEAFWRCSFDNKDSAQKLDEDEARVAASVAQFCGVREFEGASPTDLEALIQSTRAYSAAKGLKLVRQGETHRCPALLLCTSGQAGVFVKSTSIVGHSEDELVAKVDAPFVAGEGRLLTGAPANATIVTMQPSEILVCRLRDFEELMDARNSAVRSLESHVVRRAEERVKATGLSISHEKLYMYREFFTDVDVTRSGAVTLAEVVEALQVRGTYVNMRDVERAFRDVDSDSSNELNFEQFVAMCDLLVKRGKRIFDKGKVSEILKDTSAGYLLHEALVAAVERTWKQTAVHEPSEFRRLRDRVDGLSRRRVRDPAYFLPSVHSKSHLKADEDADAEGGFEVVDADDAMLAVMDFWEAEHRNKARLLRVGWARGTICSACAKWLKRHRDRTKERASWMHFLKQRQPLSGAIAFESLIELVEDAYGAPVGEQLATRLYADYEDAASRLAAADSVALAAVRMELRRQLSALRIQHGLLRTRLGAARSSWMLKLKCVCSAIAALPDEEMLRNGSGSITDGLEIDLGIKIAGFIRAARTPDVNTEAAFLAMIDSGLVVDGARHAGVHVKHGASGSTNCRRPYHKSSKGKALKS